MEWMGWWGVLSGGEGGGVGSLDGTTGWGFIPGAFL